MGTVGRVWGSQYVCISEWPGYWGSLTEALRAGGPPMLLQHVASYRNFVNTLPCLMLTNELRVMDSVLNDVREILSCQALFWLLDIKLKGVVLTFDEEQIREVSQQAQQC